jgi:hypothetical protein
MRKLRTALLLVIAASAMGVLAWRWWTERGLVTLEFTNTPLSTVIKSIERQGRVEIVTNADPAALVTIRLNRALLFEAIETLAQRIDANAKLAYIAAPTSEQIRAALSAFSSGANPGDWMVFSAQLGGRFMVGNLSAVDPRRMEWRVTQTTDRNLHTLLDQGAQKTGALFATPLGWNPWLTKLPAGGDVGEVTAKLIRTAKGTAKELFLLTVHSRDDDQSRQGEAVETAPGRTLFSAPPRTQPPNPEWTAERAQAVITLLPPDQQDEAHREYNEMRTFWESIRQLPEPERRAKIEEHLSNPDVEARMEEQAAARDARRTPEQREQRYRNYIRRKEQIKGAPTKS